MAYTMIIPAEDVLVFEQNPALAAALPERCFLYNLSSVGYSITIEYSCDKPSWISVYLRFFRGQVDGGGDSLGGVNLLYQKVAATSGKSITLSGTFPAFFPGYNGYCYAEVDGELSQYDSQPYGFVQPDDIYVDCALYQYSSSAISAFSVYRCDADGTPNESGTRAKISGSYAVSPIGDNNTKALEVKWREVGTETWSEPDEIDILALEYSDSIPETVLSGTFAANKSYEVQAVLADLLNTVTNTKTLKTATAIMHFNANKDGVAIGKFSEGPGLDVGLDARFRGTAQFDVAPLIDADQMSAFLAHLMPACKLSAPTAENVTGSVPAYPLHVLAFQTVSRNDGDAYGILLGGSGGARKMGWIIPADGVYLIIIKARIDGGTSTSLVPAIAGFDSDWTPPTTNTLAGSTVTAAAKAGCYDEKHYPNITGINTSQLTGVMVLEAGDKIWPSFILGTAVTRTIVSAQTWASIQRIG